jgi:DNA-binding transcriptional regulator LsrR (DeoR family)
MHKVTTNMHKPSPILRKLERQTADSFENEDAEHLDRLANVLLYHSKGYSQSEIASKLNVNQSTISRDLTEIRKNAKKLI